MHGAKISLCIEKDSHGAFFGKENTNPLNFLHSKIAGNNASYTNGGIVHQNESAQAKFAP
jgi:hypothetical protein